MRNRTKALTSTLALLAMLAVSAPAAHAAEYWASSSSPSVVRDNSGAALGHAYGRGYNTTVYVNNKATYKRVSGSYGIYVQSRFSFYYKHPASEVTGWHQDSSHRHQATSGTAWYSTTKNHTLRSDSSQSRVTARACNDVPFLVPGNCTGNHILTNSY